MFNFGNLNLGVSNLQYISLSYTRSMITAALKGDLQNVSYQKDPIFDLAIPLHRSGVPNRLLNARNTWEDKDAYDRQACKLSLMFIDNFKKYNKRDE